MKQKEREKKRKKRWEREKKETNIEKENGRIKKREGERERNYEEHVLFVSNQIYYSVSKCTTHHYYTNIIKTI